MNKDLINQFILLQTYYRQQNDVGRSSAYTRAIIALRSFEEEITSVKQVNNLKHIGPKIIVKINEYLTTGKIQAVEDIRDKIEEKKELSDKEKVLKLLQTVHGIGKVKATKLYDEGMRTIKDLRKNPKLLTSSSRTALKYYEDLQKRIPRMNITVIYVIMTYLLDEKFGQNNYLITVAGSYRRGAPDSGDIDCLISSDIFKLADVVKLFREKKVIIDTLEMSLEKFLGIGQCPSGGPKFRLDLEFIPENEYGSALLYFTGSREFNMSIRADAKKQGLLLNEHGLFDGKNKKVLFSPTEQDIFTRLGRKYVLPERR